jgi:hypothetical protein
MTAACCRRPTLRSISCLALLALTVLLAFAGLAPADNPRSVDQIRADIQRRREEMRRKVTEDRPKFQDFRRKVVEEGPKPDHYEPSASGGGEFRCPEGKFRVLVPAKPKTQTLNVGGVSARVYTAENPEGGYAVAYADLPIPAGEPLETTRKRLLGARTEMIRNIDATLKGESAVTLDGKYPGLEVRAELPYLKGIVRGRVYLVGQRMYQIVAIGTPAWVNSAGATRFLNSLTLTH